MSQPAPRIAAMTPAPFDSAADAWFWTMRALRARHDGETRHGGPATPRPCDPDDVVCCLDRLFRGRRIDARHARVLCAWGEKQLAPDGRGCGAGDYALWETAIAELGSQLRLKGIVRATAAHASDRRGAEAGRVS
jgi:hypothetical protein